MFELPTAITINGKQHPIRNKGDYRMILDCFGILNDGKLDKTERVLSSLIIFYDGLKTIRDLIDTFDNLEEAIQKMFDFFECGQPETSRASNDVILINWDKDEQLIASAINQMLRRDIRMEPYIHWWTFVSYYMGISGNCALANVVSIRNKIVKGKKLEQWEKEFRRDNPSYFIWNSKSSELQEFENEILKNWNNPSG